MSEQFEMLTQFLPRVSAEQGALATHCEEENAAASYRVLILEQSVSLARLLATGLTAECLAVETVQNLATARERMGAGTFDMLVLDMDFSQEFASADAHTVLDELRSAAPETRILALSGRNGVEGLVAALDRGADDYLPKPFSLLELMARVRALRRRAHAGSAAAAPRPRGGKLVLRRDQCRVERDGRGIDLTPREFALLEYLVLHPGKTLSRATLTQEVWNMPAEANTNIVDVYIKYLRDKLDGGFEDKLIRTVRGAGYLIQIDPEQDISYA